MIPEIFLGLLLVGILAVASRFYFTKQKPRPSMATPTIHFVRHAQGYHNLNIANHQIRDPMLTPHGEQQCALLNRTFPYIAHIDLVVASPLKRTIYTALKSFPDIIAKRKLVVIALPELQETSDLPCDTGSTIEDLKKEFAGQPVSFDLVESDWFSKKGKWAPEASAIEERARVAREWLKERSEKHIVAVTHGGLLHYLTEDWQGMDRFQGTGWMNTEFRSYTFSTKGGNNAAIIETEDSRLRRRGNEKPLSEAERRNLAQTTGKEPAAPPIPTDDHSRVASKV